MTEPQSDAPGQTPFRHADEQVTRRALAGAWRICGMGTRQEIWQGASTELKPLTGASVICLDADRTGRLIPWSSPPPTDPEQEAASLIAGRLTDAWRSHAEPALVTLQDGRVLAAHCTDTLRLRGALALLATDDRAFTPDDHAALAVIALATGHALGALAMRATSVPLERHEAVLAGQHAEISHALHTGPAQDLAMAIMAIEHLLAAGAERSISEDARIALAYAGLAGENLRQFIARMRGETPDERPRADPSPTPVPFFPGIGQEEAMLAIVREALRNSRLHAQAETVTITLARDQSAITVQVADDGRGFAGSPPSGHFGLAEMRDLAGAMGGELVISSTSGMGTTIRLTVPEPSIDRPVEPTDPTTLETPPNDPE